MQPGEAKSGETTPHVVLFPLRGVAERSSRYFKPFRTGYLIWNCFPFDKLMLERGASRPGVTFLFNVPPDTSTTGATSDATTSTGTSETTISSSQSSNGTTSGSTLSTDNTSFSSGTVLSSSESSGGSQVTTDTAGSSQDTEQSEQSEETLDSDSSASPTSSASDFCIAGVDCCKLLTCVNCTDGGPACQARGCNSDGTCPPGFHVCHNCFDLP